MTEITGRYDWCTPASLFRQLDEEFRFVLDAAATKETAKCKQFFTPEEDGLNQSWAVGGAVFCNPPYDKTMGKWVAKAAEEAGKGTTVVMLLPAKTDTNWFHDFVWQKSEIRFLKGRIKFELPSGETAFGASFPSMIVVFERRDK